MEKFCVVVKIEAGKIFKGKNKEEAQEKALKYYEEHIGVDCDDIEVIDCYSKKELEEEMGGEVCSEEEWGKDAF